MPALLVLVLSFVFWGCSTSSKQTASHPLNVRMPSQNFDMGSEFNDPIRKTTRSEKVFKGKEAQAFATQFSSLTGNKVPSAPMQWDPKAVISVVPVVDKRIVIYNQTVENELAQLPANKVNDSGNQLLGLLSKGHTPLTERLRKDDHGVYTVSCHNQDNEVTCMTVLTVEPAPKRNE